MSQPARQRPGSVSPIKKLTPEVEPVQTPSSITVDTVTESVSAQPAMATAEKPVVVAATQPADPDPKGSFTTSVRRSVKKAAETAVLQTARFPGEYSSLSAFVEGAMVRELERLATEYNDGQPFLPNTGTFRQGRPLGG